MNFKQTINFSLWCDFIQKDFLDNKFKQLVDNQIIHGATSNPAIFKEAIVSSDAYAQQISILKANPVKKIYEELAISDIKKAASILYPLYEEDNDDGFISLEVDPMLCDDAKATIEEGIRLYETIDYDNVMIKIPATKAGYEAMEELSAKGININATLIFSPQQAIESTKAINKGMQKGLKTTKAVISVFVSRLDRMLDERLKKLNLKTAQLGIINATKCYYEVEKFKNKNIRTLFASTGVKDDSLPQSYYIDNLIFPHSINTAPLNTIESYIQNNNFIESDLKTEQECNEYFELLSTKDINMQPIYNKLLQDGLDAFKVSFEELLNKIKLG